MAKRTGKPRKPGRLAEKEKVAIDLIHDINPEASYAAIAKILNRRKATIVGYVAATRQMLQYAAPRYLELHMQAAAIAAAQGNAAPSQWALERIEAQDEQGAKVRVVEAPLSGQHAGSMGGGLTVNVGIAVSQVQPTERPKIEISALPPLPAEVDGVSLNPVNAKACDDEQ